jgi:single-strand DNA-binding protein
MLNKVQLIGRLGKTPEIRQTNSGDAVASFSLATSKGWKDKTTQEWKENTQWHNVVCFGYNADKAAKLSKGQLVYVEGELQTREWTDKQGITKRITEVVLQKFDGTIKSLEKSNDTTTTYAADIPAFDDDSIPF